MDEMLSILVIEDSQADFLLIERHLKLSGLPARCSRVTSLGELQGALDAGGWDAVLSDYSIPQLNFLESLDLVKSRLPDVPLILVSGSIGEEKAVELLKLGVWDFVLKESLARLVPAIERSIRDAAVRSARKAAEEALRKSEAGYRSLFENMLEGFAYCRVIYDDIRPRDFIYLKVNKAFAELTGLENVIGKKVSEVIPGILESNRELLEIYGRVASTGRPERFETYVEPLGIWFSISVYSTEKEHFIAVFDNITERKRAEEQREKLEAELRQSQKMEAVGQLAGGIAHDFNNMLSVILGYVQIGLARLTPEAPIYKELLQIETAAQRSADLTRQLLAFSRKQVTAPVVINLNEVIKEQRKLLARLIGEDISIAFKPADDLWNIWIDPSQVDQILTNLAVNARDAIGGVGTVTIATANVALDESSGKSILLPPGEYMMLTFSDTGVGMDTATMERIFEPFFTTKGEGKGTGLGLSTVYGIVRQNEGAIHVYSEPGLGTTFRIYFPRIRAEKGEPVDKPHEMPLAGNETVLIVEDEEQILTLARTVLEQYGYQVLTAATPEDACLICEKYAGNIHLLLSDVVMPGMNGKELRARIEATKPGIRTLFMSGYTSDIIAHRGIIEEGVDFISKPFTVDSLVRKVRAVVDA